jgi:enoyl-CoA hydratase/carnithine racemase
MLHVGRQRLATAAPAHCVQLCVGDAHCLPHPEQRFDVVTMMFGVRNFAHPVVGLAECYRVLRPGGHLCLVEFTWPRGRWWQTVYGGYWHYVLPLIAWPLCGERAAYRYLRDSVLAFRSQPDLTTLLHHIGFTEISAEALSGGMIRLEKDGPLAIVTLTNPPLNVLHPHMVAELDACFTWLATDADVVVAIVTGQGERAFCAGFDIREFPGLMAPGAAAQLAQVLHASLDKIAHLGKPTIAAVNGLALGGGLELSMACDLRLVAANAQMGQPEIKLGLLPGAGGTQRLPRLVGAGIAKELMYTGDPISAEEAYRIGLANRVVPAGEALAAARQMGQTIAGMAGAALRYIQEAVDRGLDTTLEAGLQIEADFFAKVFQTEDVREGVEAFINKRTPNFRHR